MCNKGFKPKIAHLRRTQRGLSYKQIAERVGCSIRSVSRVCLEIGLPIRRPRKDWTADYLRLAEAHPDWSYRRIADELDANPSTIWAVEKRVGRVSAFALGIAAARAGLTLQQIEAMGNARHA